MKGRLAKLLLAFLVALAVPIVSALARSGAISQPARGASSTSAATVTLEDYAERVVRAARPLEELATFCEELVRGEQPEVWTSDEFDPDRALELPRREREALAASRRILPPTETVRTGSSTSVVADNRWFHDALAAYERDSARLGNDKRAEALRAVTGRLRSLADALTSTDVISPRDVNAEKGRLNTILQQPEFDKTTAKGGALQRLLEDFVRWLRELMPEFKPIAPGTNRGLSQAAQLFIFGLSAIVLLYVGWRFWPYRGGAKKKTAGRGARVVLGERLEEDQTAADLLEEAERLARSGDARAAIRKAYVALLVELGDRRLISLAQHKTNRDYLHAIRDAASAPFYSEMLPLTFDYELHWYGLRPAGDGEWHRFRERCRAALKMASG